RRQVDVVFGEGKRLRQQVPDRRLVINDEHTGAAGRGSCVAGRRSRSNGAGTLALEPGVDVALAETPLPPDANCRDLARLDQPLDGPEIDLQVVEYLFGRQEALVHHGWTYFIRLWRRCQSSR